MSGPTEIRELQSQISHQIEVLDQLVTYLESYIAKRPQEAEATREDGLVVAGVLENYYTAAETVLLRIVQQFGNQLDAERRHASLLDRATSAWTSSAGFGTSSATTTELTTTGTNSRS
jgi:hypothetical protein